MRNIIKKNNISHKTALNSKIIKKSGVKANLAIASKKKLDQEKLIDRKGVLDQPKVGDDNARLHLQKLLSTPNKTNHKLLNVSSNKKGYHFYSENIISEAYTKKGKPNLIKYKWFAMKQRNEYLLKKREEAINEKDNSEYKELTRYPRIEVARKEAIGFKNIKIEQPKFWFLPSGKKMYKERETFEHRARRQYNHIWLNTGRLSEDKLRHMEQIKIRKQAELAERKRFPKKREWQPKRKLPFAFFQIISRFKKRKIVGLAHYKLWLNNYIHNKLKRQISEEKRKTTRKITNNGRSIPFIKIDLNEKTDSQEASKRELQKEKYLDHKRQALFDVPFKWVDDDKVKLSNNMEVIKDLMLTKPDINSINWINDQLYSNLLTPVINQPILNNKNMFFTENLINYLGVKNVFNSNFSSKFRQWERIRLLILRSPFKILKKMDLVHRIYPTSIPSRNLSWNFDLAYQLMFASKPLYRIAQLLKFRLAHSVRQRIKLIALPRLAGLNHMMERLRRGLSIKGEFDFSPIYYKIEQPGFSEIYKKGFIYSLFLLRYGKIPSGILVNRHYGDYSLIPEQKLVTICETEDRHLAFIKPIAANALMKLSKQHLLTEKFKARSKETNNFKNLFCPDIAKQCYLPRLYSLRNKKKRINNRLLERFRLFIKRKKKFDDRNSKLYKTWDRLSYYKHPREWDSKNYKKFEENRCAGPRFMYTRLRLIRSLIKPDSLFYYRFTKRLQKRFNARKWSWPKKFFWRKSVKYLYKTNFKKIFYNYVSEDILKQNRSLRLIFKALVNKKFQIQRPHKRIHLSFGYDSFETSNSFNKEVTKILSSNVNAYKTNNATLQYNLIVLGKRLNYNIVDNCDIIMNELFKYFKKQYLNKLSNIDAKRFDYTVSLFKATSLSNSVYLSSFSHDFLLMFNITQLMRLSIFNGFYSPFNIATPLLNGKYNKSPRTFYRGIGDKTFDIQSLRSLLVYRNAIYKHMYADVQNMEPLGLLNTFNYYMFKDVKNKFLNKLYFRYYALNDSLTKWKFERILYALNDVNSNKLFKALFNFSLNNKTIEYKDYKLKENQQFWYPRSSLHAFTKDSLNLSKYIFPSLTRIEKIKFNNSSLFYTNKGRFIKVKNANNLEFPNNNKLVDNPFLLLAKLIDRRDILLSKKNYVSWFNFYLNNNVKNFKDTFHFALTLRKNIDDLINKVYGNIFLLPSNTNFANVALRAYGSSLNTFMSTSISTLFLRRSGLYYKPVFNMTEKGWVLFNQSRFIDDLSNLDGFLMRNDSVMKNKAIDHSRESTNFLIYNFLIKNNILKNYKAMYTHGKFLIKKFKFSKKIGERQLYQGSQINPSIQSWSEELLSNDIRPFFKSLSCYPVALKDDFPITRYDIKLAYFNRIAKEKLEMVKNFRKFVIRRYNSLIEFIGKHNLLKAPGDSYGFKLRKKDVRVLSSVIFKEYKNYSKRNKILGRRLLRNLWKLSKLIKLSGIYTLSKIKRKKIFLRVKNRIRLFRKIMYIYALRLAQANIGNRLDTALKSKNYSMRNPQSIIKLKYPMTKLLRRFKLEYKLLKNNSVIAHNFEIPFSVRAVSEEYDDLSYKLTAYNKRHKFAYQMLPKTLKPDFYRDNRVVGQKPDRGYYSYNKTTSDNKNINYTNKGINNKNDYRKNYQPKTITNTKFDYNKKSVEHDKTLAFLGNIMSTGNSNKENKK